MPVNRFGVCFGLRRFRIDFSRSHNYCNALNINVLTEFAKLQANRWMICDRFARLTHDLNILAHSSFQCRRRWDFAGYWRSELSPASLLTLICWCQSLSSLGTSPAHPAVMSRSANTKTLDTSTYQFRDSRESSTTWSDWGWWSVPWTGRC